MLCIYALWVRSARHWYDYQNFIRSNDEITSNLHQWYYQASEVKEFGSVIKMIRKHEDEIIIFFRHGMSNARAERLNGKIQRFVSNNYGIKNKDFSIYRIAGYFSGKKIAPQTFFKPAKNIHGKSNERISILEYILRG